MSLLVLQATGFSRCRWSFKAVWCLLIIVVVYFNMVAMVLERYDSASMAGPSYSENVWSFGQAMALATWVPTVLDFVLVFKGTTPSHPFTTLSAIHLC